MSGKRRDPIRIPIKIWDYASMSDLWEMIRIIRAFGFKAVIENTANAKNIMTLSLFAEEVRKV